MSNLCHALANCNSSSEYAGLFTGSSDTMRSILALYGGFQLRNRLSGFNEDLNMVALMGTSDQPTKLIRSL